MARRKGPPPRKKKKSGGRPGPSSRGKVAAIESRRRERDERLQRDRDKLLARYADVDPDGIVVCQYGTHADVALTDGTVRMCMLTPKVHKVFGICVGDRVWTERGATDEERIIVARQPRRTAVRRRRGEEDRTGHVIAANVDRMAITVALREPPLRTGALDRYLVLASVLDLEPMIVLTKIDQAPEDDPGWAVLDPYRSLDVPILPTSADSGEGLPELLAALRGGVTVFAGHSGVGKSSLCLALGIADAPIAGDMSTAHGRVRGRHTTSIASLLELPGGGGWVVDTPGVRAIGLVDLKREDARVHFPDLVEIGQDCEFVDCLHVGEDGCAVPDAVEDGRLTAVRHDGYLRLMQSLEE